MYTTLQVRGASALRQIALIAGKKGLEILPLENILELEEIIFDWCKWNEIASENGLQTRTWDEYKEANSCHCTDYQPDFGRAVDFYCDYCGRQWKPEWDSDGDEIYKTYNLIY